MGVSNNLTFACTTSGPHGMISYYPYLQKDTLNYRCKTREYNCHSSKLNGDGLRPNIGRILLCWWVYRLLKKRLRFGRSENNCQRIWRTV